MSELPKTFDPKAIEERWYAHWESRGLFRPDRPEAKPWTIAGTADQDRATAKQRRGRRPVAVDAAARHR